MILHKSVSLTSLLHCFTHRLLVFLIKFNRTLSLLHIRIVILNFITFIIVIIEVSIISKNFHQLLLDLQEHHLNSLNFLSLL